MMNRWCLAALVLGGCAVDETTSVSAWSQEIDGCDPLVCPGNSDLLGLLGPYELDATGVVSSSRGWHIAGMKLGDGQTVQDLRVVGASLSATYAHGVAAGADLIGLTLTLEHKSAQSIDMVAQFKIASAPTMVPYYAGGPPEIEGFHVTYDTGLGPKELCPYAGVDQGVASDWAVFWKGDRYDPDTGRIFASNSAVDTWFNISCAGEAPIKMLRARTGGAVASGSPVDQRQATLNMFTASYCGPGRRYTKLGQSLTWSDLSGPSEIGTVSSYEAVWAAGGAVCLDTPRLVDRKAIDCEIPTCTPSTPTSPDMIEKWQGYGWLLSGNPRP